MPLGFYQPAQIVIDAEKHNVTVRAVDVNHSEWDNTLEDIVGDYRALRLGFRQVSSLREEDMKQLIRQRPEKGYTSFQQLRNVGMTVATLERLADADAFRSMRYDRRQALWEVSTLDNQTYAIFSAERLHQDSERNITLPQMQLSEHVVHDYASTALSVKGHPVSFVRTTLQQLGVIPHSMLAKIPHGEQVKVAGLILVRQRPGTATGICFVTLEDETGISNLVIFQKLFNKYRKEVIQSKLLMVEGEVQKEGEVIHVIVRKCYNVSLLLGKLTATSGEPLTPKKSRADETTAPFFSKKAQPDVVQGNIFPEGRNFRWRVLYLLNENYWFIGVYRLTYTDWPGW